MTEFSLERVFKCEGAERANFLSRVFGLFNEEPVRFWADMESSSYEYLGRPTIYPKNETGWTTLDFAFRRRRDQQTFVAEMKCEIAYQDFRYMTLNGIDQVQRHIDEQSKSGKKSFARFVEVATQPSQFKCMVTSRSGKRNEVPLDGAILVWGDVSDDGRKKVADEFGFADILSVQDIINKLIKARDAEYLAFLSKRSNWCRQLFDALEGE